MSSNYAREESYEKCLMMHFSKLLINVVYKLKKEVI